MLNANNPVVGPDYPHLIAGHHYAASFRAERISDVLSGRSTETLDTSADLMLDTVSLAAAELLPVMMDVVVDDTRGAEVMTMLRGWDHRMDRDRPEPLIFAMWLRELNRALYADELGDLFLTYWHLRPLTVQTMLTESTDWCDNTETPDVAETCADVRIAALTSALDYLSETYGDDPAEWRWGDAHVAPFLHRVFGRIFLVSWLVDIGIETDGGEFTVNRGGMSVTSSTHPFTHIHGAGFRGVYDLADLTRSRFMMPAGQSGHPLATTYGNLQEDWRDGAWITLADPPQVLAQIGLGTTTLRPPGPGQVTE